MNARFAVLGAVSNLGLAALWVLVSDIQSSTVFAVVVSVLLLATALNFLGVVLKGSVSSDASGGILLLNFPVWIFSLWGLWFGNIGYQEDLGFCGYPGGEVRCARATEDLELAGILAVSLIATAMVTLANLLNLKRLSEQ